MANSNDIVPPCGHWIMETLDLSKLCIESGTITSRKWICCKPNILSLFQQRKFNYVVFTCDVNADYSVTWQLFSPNPFPSK